MPPIFGTGAYTVAVCRCSSASIPGSGLSPAALLGRRRRRLHRFSTFRYGLRGSYFALVTLAFAEVLRILSNSVDFTGAGVGILIPLDQGAANFQFASKAGFFWLIWAMTLAASSSSGGSAIRASAPG
jgi:branched-chain amino acid transport system permease protein